MAFVDVPFPASKRVTRVEHDLDAQILRVTYPRGHVYHYMPVTGDMADGFGQALSASEYLNTAIIGQTAEEKVSNPAE